MRDDDRLQGLRGYVRDMKAADPTVALDQRQYRRLRRDLALPVCRLAADEGFVGFHNLILAAELIAADRAGASIFDLEDGHCLADAVPEEPRRLEAAAKGAVKLAGCNALFAAAHQVDRLKPDVHRDVARTRTQSPCAP